MGRTFIITILTLLLTSTSVYPQSSDSSGTAVQKPLENLKLLPDQFHFLESDHPEGSFITESNQIDLDQLLSSYSVYPMMEFNLTDKIRSRNKKKTMIFWGGVVPFFSFPDPDESEQDSSFSEENFSIFWHLKKKF